MLGKVEICGVNTARLQTLTQTQMDELLIKAQSGDEMAKQQLVEGNLRLVLSVIQRFEKRGECPDDLFQVGCIGLIKAIDNFDPSLNVRFSTYGVPMIIGEVRRYLRDNNPIRVSRSMRELAYRSLGVREEILRRENREPSTEEIATALGEDREAVGRAMEAIVEPVSLYESVYSDGDDSVYVIDQLSDTSRGSSDESWLENIALREAVSTLTPREQAIIQMRFFKDKTQMEIAGEIGISQAQVSRLEKGALEKLRKQL